MYRSPCTHLSSITEVPLSEIYRKQAICADCDCLGPNLWICLDRNCLRIGCSENYNDHNTYHNQVHPLHSVHMNLSTKRVWCYQCESEVFPEYITLQENNNPKMEKMQDSDCVGCSKVYSSNNEPNNIFAFESTVGLNVGMSGDTSDSSDGEDNSSAEPDKPYGLVGLQNIGNTCYMNAALQALSNTLPLTSFFLECSAAVILLSEGRKPGLSRTYQALIKDIWIKKRYGYVTPSGILYGIRNVHAMFRGYHQHDTQEFLRNFMDQLHEELKQICPPELSNEIDTYSLTVDESAMNSSFESSEGEYETCDSGVSERSSLSDETERPTTVTKRRLTRSTSPCHRLRPHFQNTTIDSQPSSSSTSYANSAKKQFKYRSIISDVFDGKLLSSVQCLTCSRVSSRVETFQDLSLPIPSRDHLVVLHGRSVDSGVTACSEAIIPMQDGWFAWIISWLRSWFYGPTISLHDCLAAFFSTDELKGDNMYSCERCNKLRNGIKFSKVMQLPEVLCIHLKRFRHELMFSSKISSFVSFPLKGLDVRPYLHADCVSNIATYELFSVICHHGTAGGGHYTCYSLNGNQWYEFDDQYVTKVSAETVQACEAYVLFYRKNTSAAQAVKVKASELAELYNDALEGTVYISKQWLSRFKTCAEPGPIDNSDFLCHHGSVHPERVTVLQQLAFALPKQVYEYLHKKFGGCPPITDIHECSICQNMQKRIASELETFLKLNRDFLTHRLPSTHLLSATWFSQWQNFVQRRSYDPPGPIDNSRTLTGVNNDYIEINQEMWQFFYNIYDGGPEIPVFQNRILHQTESETNLCSATVTPSNSGDAEIVPAFKRQTSKNNKSKQYCHHTKGKEIVQSKEFDNKTVDLEMDQATNSNLALDNQENSFVADVSPNNSISNNYNDRYSPNVSSTSNTSLTDDETGQGDLNYFEHNKAVTKAAKEKLYYKTKRRRFRCKIGYKNKHVSGGVKSVKQRDVW